MRKFDRFDGIVLLERQNAPVEQTYFRSRRKLTLLLRKFIAPVGEVIGQDLIYIDISAVYIDIDDVYNFCSRGEMLFLLVEDDFSVGRKKRILHHNPLRICELW